jgi:hypothetical protein
MCNADERKGKMGVARGAAHLAALAVMSFICADEKKTKMEVAKEVLTGIVDQLDPQDSLSIVLFRWGPAGVLACLLAAVWGLGKRQL